MKLPIKLPKPNKKFDWKKTAKKAAFAAAITILAAFIAYAESEPVFMALVPILIALQNFMKHKFKW